MDKKHEIKLNKINKILNIKSISKDEINAEDGKMFIEDYQKSVANINGKEYDMFFDCTQIPVFGRDEKNDVDMLAVATGCIDLYVGTGFKKITFDCTGNPIMAMQLSRILRQKKIYNAEVIK